MTNETKCPMCDGSRVRLITFSDDELGTEPCHACGPVCAIISKCDQVQRIADGHVQTIAKLEAERDALRKRVEQLHELISKESLSKVLGGGK